MAAPENWRTTRPIGKRPPNLLRSPLTHRLGLYRDEVGKAPVLLLGGERSNPMMPTRNRKDFEDVEASQLCCPTCKRAMPVRKCLLLALLDRETFDYICARCGTPIGKKEEPLRKAAPGLKI